VTSITELRSDLPLRSAVEQELAAEQAAGRVYGLRAAVEALSWNSVVPADRVKVRVEDGWLTPEGDVDWTYQETNGDHVTLRGTVAAPRRRRGARS
jgi:osmotically-inducible protein OsmY